MEFRVISELNRPNGEEQLNIDSSNIKSAKYSVNEQLLTIEFNNRSVYEYYEVPRFVYLLFKNGIDGSNGKAFWMFIRRANYNYKKIR